MEQKNAELENMAMEKEMAQTMVEQTKNILNEQAQELEEKDNLIDNLRREGVGRPMAGDAAFSDAGSEDLDDDHASALEQLKEKAILIEDLEE
eukprot:scaffold18712_cov54-Cylindrotheca_fusiformis.AAC.1